jgi:glycosyltransferase involved in cell wall biosynthesis
VGPDAGILVPPGDASALANALGGVVGSPALREQLAEGARRARSRMPSWDSAVALMAHTIEHVDE